MVAITHYTRWLNDEGEPDIVMAEGMDPGDIIPLPDGFDRKTMHWRPRGDLRGQWVEDVAGERSRLWGRVKRDRDATIDAGLSIAGIGKIDTDAAARAAIDSAAVSALMNPTATWAWTLADDTVVTINAAQVRQMKQRVDELVQMARRGAMTLRKGLGAASSVKALRAAVTASRE